MMIYQSVLKKEEIGERNEEICKFQDTSKLKWIFREEYINIPENNLVIDFDRLVEIEPAVLGIIWGLVESFRSIASEFNSMEGAADKATFGSKSS